MSPESLKIAVFVAHDLIVLRRRFAWSRPKPVERVSGRFGAIRPYGGGDLAVPRAGRAANTRGAGAEAAGARGELHGTATRVVPTT